MHKLPTRKQVIETLFEKWIPEDRTEMIPVDEALNRVLAMGNISEVEVYRKPRVAFLPTGNELVLPGAEVRRGNNIDSNSILAKSMLRVNRCVWR